MKPLSDPDQDLYLYDGKWNVARDTYLINCLVEREAECKPTPPADSPHALICAMEALNKEIGAQVTYSEVLNRVNFLMKRYACFKKLCARVETTWDLRNNRVTADEKVWRIIFRDDPFTRAYCKNGDPLWFKLCRLFGMNDIKQEGSPTLIVISDSPHALEPLSTNKSFIQSDDEVTSPVMKPPAARKLNFVDDAESSVGPHTSKGYHLYHVWPPIERRFTVFAANGPVAKAKDTDGEDKGNDHSSCASWSPQI